MSRLLCWVFGHKTETESVYDIPLGSATAKYGDEYLKDGFIHMKCTSCTRCFHTEYEPTPVVDDE